MTYPVSGFDGSPLVLALLGLVVGILGGAFGVGGSFLAGPVLFLLGMPLHYVVGTDLAHIAGKSLIAARHHDARGNVDRKLAAMLVPTTVAGVELGARSLVVLQRSGHTDVIAAAYALLLTLLAVFIFVEGVRARRRRRQNGEPLIGSAASAALGAEVDLPGSRRRGSIFLIAIIGVVSGFLGGLLGGGVGYARMPALVYLLGVPTKVAIGTDLLEVIVSAGYGAFTHALKGNVDFAAALTMQVGGVIGSRFGVHLTTKVREATLRAAFAPLPLIGAALVVLRLLRGGAEP